MFLRYRWEQLKSISQLADEQAKKSKQSPLFWAIVFSILTLLAIAFITLIPTLLNANFWVTLTAYMVCLIINVLIIMWVTKDIRMKHPWYNIFIVLIVLVNLLPLIPFRKHGNENHAMKPGEIYVTHLEDCAFCQVARTPMQIAIGLYNATHDTNVQYVERNANTKLAKQLDKLITSNGMVVKMEEIDGKTVPVTSIYTLQDNGGNPKRPSLSYIYDRIKEVDNVD